MSMILSPCAEPPERGYLSSATPATVIVVVVLVLTAVLVGCGLTPLTAGSTLVTAGTAAAIVLRRLGIKITPATT